MRYQAPKHVTSVHTSAGNHYIADKNGVIDVPANAPPGDHVSLCSAGWTPLEAKKAAGADTPSLADLRKEYAALSGKKPSPSMKADALGAKITELKASAEPAGE